MSPLREIVDGIHGQVAKIEDDLKVIPFLTTTQFIAFLCYLIVGLCY